MKISDFVRLDIKSIRAYFSTKSTIVLIGITFVIVICFEVFGEHHIPFQSLMMFGFLTSLFGTILFSIEERNDINTFYITQLIPRDTVVKGRFLCVILLNLIGVLISAVIDIFGMIVTGNLAGLMAEIIAAMVVFLIILLYNAFSFPIYFKLGFVRGRILAAITPLIIILVGAYIIVFAFPTGLNISKNINFGVVISALAVVTAIVTYISILLSKKFYRTREF